MPEETSQNELVELNRRLNDKNKELLDQLEERNRNLVGLQKDIGEERAHTERTMLRNSTEMEERKELEDNMLVLAE